MVLATRARDSGDNSIRSSRWKRSSAGIPYDEHAARNLVTLDVLVKPFSRESGRITAADRSLFRSLTYISKEVARAGVLYERTGTVHSHPAKLQQTASALAPRHRNSGRSDSPHYSCSIAMSFQQRFPRFCSTCAEISLVREPSLQSLPIPSRPTRNV
jgi:hypothetical protein